MRLPGFRDDEVWGVMSGGTMDLVRLYFIGGPGFWALGWAGWVGFSELESEPGEFGLLDLVQ
jgi:hypothetical protein